MMDAASPNIPVENLLNEWMQLSEEFVKLEADHESYLQLLEALHKKQEENSAKIRVCGKDLRSFSDKIKAQSKVINADNELDDKIKCITFELAEKHARLEDMAEQLPRKRNGLYLDIILGHINISITNKTDKFLYKDQYEKFKITVTLVCMAFATLALCFHFRVLDACFHFLLVWYYCTLTIRESILRCNGSRIKGWWLAHHYVSAVLCGILLTWPDGASYQSFRVQFLLFSLYLTGVQLIQCQYQRGCLYRLRSLGDSHSMAITIDGFHMWMFRGLTFVLPFLIIGYMLQLYNAYTLFNIWFESTKPIYWQIFASALLFLFLAVGNTVTTMQVCYRKFTEAKKAGHSSRLKAKYSVVEQINCSSPDRFEEMAKDR